MNGEIDSTHLKHGYTKGPGCGEKETQGLTVLLVCSERWLQSYFLLLW